MTAPVDVSSINSHRLAGSASASQRAAGDRRLRLLVLSHVLPFPRSAGQQQRVFYTLQAARRRFHVTFAAVADHVNAAATRQRLLETCDDVIVLPSAYRRNVFVHAAHRAASCVYAAATGLRRSNYALSVVEFRPSRVRALLQHGSYDCALFEYWHAARSAADLQAQGIPCVLDMHDVLWNSYARVLEPHSGLLGPWKRRALDRYRTAEVRAWNAFDAVIAINRDEERVVAEAVSDKVSVFHAAMGTDLGLWPYSPEPATPPRVAYYGALSSLQNQQCATTCLTRLMPAIWARVPNAEFWVVGSNPPASIRRWTSDPRVRVTGYVEDVQQVLRTMTAVLCPWVGTFGFRSRLIEVMALGVPVVVSPDAVHGMELREGEGVLIGRTEAEQAELASALVMDAALARQQGRRGRQQVEQVFSLENTYDALVSDLERWLRARRPDTEPHWCAPGASLTQQNLSIASRHASHCRLA